MSTFQLFLKDVPEGFLVKIVNGNVREVVLTRVIALLVIVHNVDLAGTLLLALQVYLLLLSMCGYEERTICSSLRI